MTESSPLLRSAIGDVLRGARTEQGLTLRQVSSAASMSLGHLSEIERGAKESSSEIFRSVCAALNIPMSEVLRDAGAAIANQERLAAQDSAVAKMPRPHH